MSIKTSETTIAGQTIPVYHLNTVVLGAGAAGMSAVLHLYDFYTQAGLADAADRVACVTTGLPLGTSRMSGSDKQTYYKMGTSPKVPDTPVEFAKSLTAGGCCHGDHALIEGVNSLRQFYRLVDAGVPFPHDPDGAFIGYKTDHDPFERATSAGPKTSKFMSECLEQRVRSSGCTIFDQHELVELVRDGAGRIVALLTIDKQRAAGGDDPGYTLFRAENVILATGGPGQIYKVTVYPRGQVGIHGIAYRAGLIGNNMTESQYGLASTRFRWNVSGTYMQVVPRIYSTAADGVSDEREFLTEYFPSMEKMATNIFLKGYQWPFDAQRIDDCQSSMVDMAVHKEIFGRGRRVFMDFLKNPIGQEGWKPFAVADLEDDARIYLERTGAQQELPIDRLVHMNQPAIDIYTENGIDLHGEPLEIGVCAQHQNGGFAVDAWWQSNIPHTFIIGETAGTHGVKRPGGSALNAGQAGALRASEYIANVYGPEVAQDGLDAAATGCAGTAIERAQSYLSSEGPGPDAVMDELCERMSLYGAHIRDSEAIDAALEAAVGQYRALSAAGLKAGSTAELAQCVQAESQCLLHVGQLFAIKDLIAKGLGSRGSYVVLDPAGKPMPAVLGDAQTGKVPHWRPENPELKQTIQEVRYSAEAPELFVAEQVPCRPAPDRDVAFEPMWTAYREKRIFDA
ncbi:MAG: FAD-binding protein [Planctomycetota bacterium]